MKLEDAKKFAQLVLLHRKLSKLLNTYVDPLSSKLTTSSYVNASGEYEKKFVVRPTWMHTGTGNNLSLKTFPLLI